MNFRKVKSSSNQSPVISQVLQASFIITETINKTKLARAARKQQLQQGGGCPKWQGLGEQIALEQTHKTSRGEAFYQTLAKVLGIQLFVA